MEEPKHEFFKKMISGWGGVLSAWSPVSLFAGSPVRLFACSPVRLIACSPVRLFACAPAHLFACSPIRPKKRGAVRLFACLRVCLFACLPVRLFACSHLRLFACCPEGGGSGAAPLLREGGAQRQTLCVRGQSQSTNSRPNTVWSNINSFCLALAGIIFDIPYSPESLINFISA